MTTSFMQRRKFLKYSLSTCIAIGGAGLWSGCAVDPVTGQKQLMMVSRNQEIDIDRQQSPFQYSSDYGLSDDRRLQEYVGGVGKNLLPYVHRPDMPYNFNVVNATYVNAYAFPGGSIAVTRGILLKIDNEAQLAALLGHELGHVNARHSAEQMSKGQLSYLLVTGLSMAANAQGAGYGELAQKLGMLGQGVLLSKYSRDNEREADALGNEYMVKAGYPSQGFVMLMEMLDAMHQGSDNAVQVLFSTHPMSRERLNAAVQREKSIYSGVAKKSLQTQRFKDNTAALRAKRKGIEALQEGEKHLAAKAYDLAEADFGRALTILDADYCAHVLMAKCLMIRNKTSQALTHAAHAKRINPSEAQGYYIAGLANTGLKRWGTAYDEFEQCGKVLPGNPQLTFYRGYCLDKQGNVRNAAVLYQQYLKEINYQPNDYAKYAVQRLQKWGIAK